MVCLLCNIPPLAHAGRSIQVQIQRQHVDPRLAQKAQLAAFDVLIDKLTDGVRRGSARFGYPVYLCVSGCGTDVRVQTAAGIRQ